MASIILQKSPDSQCPSCSLNSLEIDDFHFCDCKFMGETTSLTNDKSVDINFTVKEEQLQHIKFPVSQTLFKTFFNEKLENKKLLAKKMFKTKLLCTYNKEDKYVINMENASESQETNA